MNKTKIKKYKVINQDVKIVQWLEQATQIMADEIFSPLGYKVPKKLRINVAPIKTSKHSRANTTLGQCYPTAFTGKAQVNIIQMNIATTGGANTGQVLSTLAHELIHAIDNNASGHKKGGAFDKMARAIGLDGMLTATFAGKELAKRLNGIQKKIGKFPTASVDLSGLRRDHNRNLKVVCSGTENDCDHGFNTNKMRIEQMLNETGSIKCLCCGVGDYHVQLSKKWGSHKVGIRTFFALTSDLVKTHGKIDNLNDLIGLISEEVEYQAKEVDTRSAGERLAEEVFNSIVLPS